MPTTKTFLYVVLYLTCYYTGSNIPSVDALSTVEGRRAFVSHIGTATAAVIGASSVLTESPDVAAAAVVMQNTENGIKYAVTKESTTKGYPQKGDIVAIEYTGYLTNGQIFDSTHAVGQNQPLAFILGGNAVIPGLNDIVYNMKVGQKVQAIVPPTMAFGDKGICKEDGDCLITPGSTLVYDVYLKKSSIPPP